MGARAPTQFILTPKGVDELSQRTYRLDARVRNILFLIQKGTPTVEGILENTIFPQDEVVERLQKLLREEFVALGGRHPVPPPAEPAPPSPPLAQAAAPAPAPTLAPTLALATQSAAPRPATLVALPVPSAPPAPPMPLGRVASDFPQLDNHASVSQARFVLSDFCLDLFGTKGKPLIEQIDAAADVESLQQVLELVTREVRKHRRSQMSALLARVREINQLPASPKSGLGADFGT